ncbi:hypothetical protein J6590_073483 [Homalodisca vitripennis]|nr:hypothetical protein J6590_073483 [Homalodisca vitripennis]
MFLLVSLNESNPPPAALAAAEKKPMATPYQPSALRQCFFGDAINRGRLSKDLMLRGRAFHR